jgi:hypothetical protein
MDAIDRKQVLLSENLHLLIIPPPSLLNRMIPKEETPMF